MQELLTAIEIETCANPQFSVIWMHGLGADGSDFVPVVPELGLGDEARVRFIFPHAPFIPVTCNGGYIMRAWYDILSLESDNREIDEAGILASRQAIRALIARENQRGIPSQRIFLAGFSQGGAVAYMTALTHPEKLAGLMALSTYIPAPDLLAAEMTEANQSLPVFIAHGTEDGVVSLNLGFVAKNFLRQRNYPVDWHEYPIMHTLGSDEIKDLGQWLRAGMAAYSLD